MTDQRMVKNLERFRIAINSHDRENPTHTAWGIGLNQEDIDRLGFEIGEELWFGITIQSCSVKLGSLWVMCDGDHADGRAAEAKQEYVKTVGAYAWETDSWSMLGNGPL